MYVSRTCSVFNSAAECIIDRAKTFLENDAKGNSVALRAIKAVGLLFAAYASTRVIVQIASDLVSWIRDTPHNAIGRIRDGSTLLNPGETRSEVIKAAIENNCLVYNQLTPAQRDNLGIARVAVSSYVRSITLNQPREILFLGPNVKDNDDLLSFIIDTGGIVCLPFLSERLQNSPLILDLHSTSGSLPSWAQSNFAYIDADRHIQHFKPAAHLLALCGYDQSPDSKTKRRSILESFAAAKLLGYFLFALRQNNRNKDLPECLHEDFQDTELVKALLEWDSQAYKQLTLYTADFDSSEEWIDKLFASSPELAKDLPSRLQTDKFLLTLIYKNATWYPEVLALALYDSFYKEIPKIDNIAVAPITKFTHDALIENSFTQFYVKDTTVPSPDKVVLFTKFPYLYTSLYKDPSDCQLTEEGWINIAQNNVHCLQYLPPALQESEEFMERVCNSTPLAIQYAPDHMRANERTISRLMTLYPAIFYLASKEIRANPEYIDKALKFDPLLIHFVVGDYDGFYPILESNPALWNRLNSKFKGDFRALLAVLPAFPAAVKTADPTIVNTKEKIEALIERNASVRDHLSEEQVALLEARHT